MTAEVIRIATPADAPALQAIYAPYVIETPISFELVPPTVEEMAERVRRIGAVHPWLAYEADGAILGYAYAAPFKERAAYQWSVESTVYVARGAHRRGVGKALYARLHAILTLQGHHSVFGGITLPNAGSVGLHEACGYEPVGVYREVGFKLGSWEAGGMWAGGASSSAGHRMTRVRRSPSPKKSGETPSVPEYPHPGEHHGHAAFVGGVDHRLVANGAAGLDHRGATCVGGLKQTIGEGEESLGGAG